MRPRLIKIACAISGGVDSAVAALLLKSKGYHVTGIFMKNWDVTNETGDCTVDKDREDAAYVCDHLGIPFHEVNFVKEYWNEVFSELVHGYENGITPNPDVLCNRHIKFGAFFKYAMETFGADAVATGHYARTSREPDFSDTKNTQGTKLLLPFDKWKDQTLFLSQIKQEALQKTLFPLGDLKKTRVKQIAKEAGLEKIVKKKESMGICFIGSRNFKSFIEEYIEPKTGNFIDIETGAVVGQHKGTHFWTVGQRSLLGGLRTGYYIAEINAKTQDIYVAGGTNHPALYTESLHTDQPHWIHEPLPGISSKPVECEFKFQHVHPITSCTVHQNKNGFIELKLPKPFRAITPGQYAVLYNGEECLGGAQILRPGQSLYELNQRQPIETDKAFA